MEKLACPIGSAQSVYLMLWSVSLLYYNCAHDCIAERSWCIQLICNGEVHASDGITDIVAWRQCIACARLAWSYAWRFNTIRLPCYLEVWQPKDLMSCRSRIGKWKGLVAIMHSIGEYMVAAENKAMPQILAAQAVFQKLRTHSSMQNLLLDYSHIYLYWKWHWSNRCFEAQREPIQSIITRGRKWIINCYKICKREISSSHPEVLGHLP